MVLSRTCECDVCEDVVLTNRTLLPDDWGLLWDIPYLLCDSCISKWKDRWGDEPMMLIKGKDKELSLFEEMR